MTPGVAFFYGGMVRAKAVLNMMIMEAAALSVTMIMWVLWGWSIAYAGTSVGGIFGDPATGFLLKDTMVSDKGVFTSAALNGNNYPVSVDVAFQSAFAMITVALICGAIAERVKYSTWMIFVALWITFDYAPLAHMVWNGGLLSADGAISPGDAQPPTISQVAWLSTHQRRSRRSGHRRSSASVRASARSRSARTMFRSSCSAPSCCGSVGSASTPVPPSQPTAPPATRGFPRPLQPLRQCSPGASPRRSAPATTPKWVPLPASSRASSPSPPADVVSPLWAIVLGAIAGVLTCLACGLKFKLGYDDSLDVVGVHGVGGFTGTVLIGFFGEGTGLFAGGDWRQLVVQLIVALVGHRLSAVITGIIAFCSGRRRIGWRVTEAQRSRRHRSCRPGRTKA